MILRTQYAKLHSEGADESAAAPAPAASAGGKGKQKDARGGKNSNAASSSASASSAAGEGWQITNVIDAIKELTASHSSSAANSRLNWKNILENEIDHPKLMIQDEKSWCLYVDIYRYATTGVYANSAAAAAAGSPPAFSLPSLDFLLRDWKHSPGHLSMLRWALPSSISVFSFLPPAPAHAQRSSRSILAAANQTSDVSAPDQDDSTIMTLSSTGATVTAGAPIAPAKSLYQSWLSLDLFESLIESVPASIAASPTSPSSAAASSASPPSSPAQALYASLRSLLSVALERCPDLLSTGLLSVRPKSKPLQQHLMLHLHSLIKDELTTCMMPVHLAVQPHATAQKAFQELWETRANAPQNPTSKAAVFWIMRYWIQNSVDATNTSALPSLLLALGTSLRRFLEQLLQASSAPLTVDLFTTAPSSGSAAAGSPPASAVPINIAKWFHLKYATEMTSNQSKEMFVSLLWSYLKDNLNDVVSFSQGAEVGVPPFRLSVESVAVMLKSLLTLQGGPPALMNEIQMFYGQNSAQLQPLQPPFMSRIGTTLTLNTYSEQQRQQMRMMQQAGAGMSQHPAQHMNAMGGPSSASNIGHTTTGSNQINDTALVAGMGAPGGPASVGDASSTGEPDESMQQADAEANSYFQRIYTGAMSLDSVVEMLLRYRSSSIKRERDVCLCMIHNLFDEYRFFHKYPVRELQITGLLFGALISHKLVSGFTLGIALRFVLEALRKSPDSNQASSKMFSFGLWAIQQFKQRIASWPQYAMLILHIPHIQQAQPELANFLQQVIMSQNTPEAAAAAAANGEPMDFSANGTSSFSMGFHSDAQSISSLASLTEAERNADLQASAARSALDRASQSANLGADASHLPPGLGIGKPTTPGPGPALAAGVVLGGAGAGAAASNPAGPIGARAGAPIAGNTAAGAGNAPASSFGSTLNIDSLLSAEGDAPLPLAPSEGLKDKIHFIINNVTKSNLRQKGRELKLILRAEYLPYFSRYLVIKRVSIEANFQRLYAAFLDYVGVPDLRKVMLETTYYNIQVLLRNDKIVSSSSERSLLKNLGSWLGLLTIAKNKPIRSKYLDVKTLILEAYDTGRLIAVIPFAAKVLESCAESKVFKPPNPWLMAVVGLLREIFDLPGLKLNLKFEIEVLFNHLLLKMSEVKASKLLKDRQMHKNNSRQNEKMQAREREQAQAANMGGTPFPLLPTPGNPLVGKPPLKPPTSLLPGSGVRSPSPNMNEEDPRGGLGSGSGAFAPPTGGTAGSSGMTLSAPGGVDTLLIPNLSQYVIISSSINLFQAYPALKRCVPTAIDRAIREIINPVVERSLAIACVTSRELILKVRIHIAHTRAHPTKEKSQHTLHIGSMPCGT